MWMLFAFLSALFAGLTAILAKIGIRNIDSTVATAIRTVVVLIFAWIMAFLTGSVDLIKEIEPRSLLFLILSGLATGASWLCYYHALALGDINKVLPVDKSSTILTILFAILLFGETDHLLVKLCGIFLIAVGTYLMIQKKTVDGSKNAGKSWLFYAALSAVFAALQSLLAKIGVENVESNLATAIRTCVVLIMAWMAVFATKKTSHMKDIRRHELVFILLSGITTGASWLCYYRALADGPASVVVPIDKLSIVVSIAFAYFAFGEKLSKKALTGLFLIIAGTLGMTIFS